MIGKDTVAKIANWGQRMLAELPSIEQKILDNRKKVIAEENAAWDKELGAAQDEAYKAAYYDVIDAFYNSYDPSYYVRHYSMYLAWSTEFDNDGLVRGTVESGQDGWTTNYDEFFSANLDGTMHTSMREGGLDSAEFLFHQAFDEGWHGGAKSIDAEKAEIWGAHPKPGTPYYRKPGRVTYPDGETKWHKYGKWGKRANKMRPAPRKLFEKKINELNKGRLADIDDALFEKHKKNTTERVKAYEAELLAPLAHPDWLDDFR